MRRVQGWVPATLGSSRAGCQREEPLAAVATGRAGTTEGPGDAPEVGGGGSPSRGCHRAGKVLRYRPSLQVKPAVSDVCREVSSKVFSLSELSSTRSPALREAPKRKRLPTASW